MVQLVGQRCVVCEQRIAVAGDGWNCAACAAPQHYGCADNRADAVGLICARCAHATAPADLQRVYALTCPRCRLSHQGSLVDRCESCGMTCSWADAATFRSEMRIRRAWGRRRLVTALRYMLAALVPLMVLLWVVTWPLFWILLMAGPIGVIAALLIASMILTATGWLLVQAWRALLDALCSRQQPVLATAAAGSLESAQ